MSKLIISAFGQDRPGMVASVTQLLFDNRYNIEDTSMTILEDHFTMLFIVTPPKETGHAELCAKLAPLGESMGLKLDVHPIEALNDKPMEDNQPWMISVSGSDQTGIIYHVTQVLAQHQANIRHLSSKRLTRADGNSLFLMALEVDLPAHALGETLKADLKTLSGAEKLEILAEPMDVYTL